MADLETKLAELEDSIYNAEITVKNDTATMSNKDTEENVKTVKKYPYLYIIAALIPVISAIVLYFLKPKFITKKEKGKQVVNLVSLAKYVGLITVIGLATLFALNYSGVLPDSMLV